MKKLLSSLVILAFAIIMSISSFANRFEIKKQYTDDLFSDVSTSEWYYSEVKSAYNLGFINGIGQNLFSPNGKVTVAEAITMASRVHASYHNKTISSASGEWYQMYINYAIDEGIIKAGQFDNYDRNIKRYEMAVVFFNSVPSSWLNQINSVNYLPDINEMADYRDEILALYNSGIVMGNDVYGTFYPNNEIIRSEASAIINRIAIPDNRLKRTLQKRPSPVPALYYIDDTADMNINRYGQYGWEFDQRGGPVGGASQTIYVLDVSKTETTAMLRTFAEQKSGIITMETNCVASFASDGLNITLGNDDNIYAMHFITKDNKFHAVEGDRLVDTGVNVPSTFTIKTITDLDNKTNSLILDGKFIGTYGFGNSSCDSVNTIKFSGDKENEVIAKFNKTKLYTGYALNEIFMASDSCDYLPYNWKLDGGATGKLIDLRSNSYDSYSAEISVPSGKTGILSTEFSPITRKVCYEMKFLMNDYVDGTKFSLSSKGNEIISIVTNGDSYYSATGEFLRKYNSKVWQSLRIEANTDTGIVVYKINNKEVGRGLFTSESFDGISISVPATKDTVMIVDDFFVYNMFDEEPDYVPEPVPVESDKAIVGIEVCDIWRNGFQHGWDYTSAYDELYTYLGMYDEGSTEVADWETKWLVEHGVDFKLVCWYSGTSTEPVKTPRNSYGLTAQLNSKYSNMMKYAIMWENAGNNPTDSTKFRENIVAYWVEYYLSDKDRYFTINNKPIISIYNQSKLIEVFGSEAAVKKELDYLREVCVGLGYDGAIILTTGTPSAVTYNMGFDGVYAYNWGQSAYMVDHQIKSITNQDKLATNNGLTCVPTVGVGFSNMFLGQGNKRSPLITPDDYEKILTWTTNEFLANRKSGEPWQTEMVILSNWNEFGEGHYILPTNRIGFTYLDAIRKSYSSAHTNHTDLRPEDDTRARYNALYDQDRKRVRLYELANKDDLVQIDEFTSVIKWDFTDSTTEKIFKINHGTSVEYTGSSVKGKSNGADFAIVTERDINLDANKAEYLRIVYKATAASTKDKAQFFFLTTTDTVWDEKKYLTFDIITDGEYHEYLVNMSSCGLWNGVISKVRFDPISRGDCEWEIKSFEFLDLPGTYEVYLNGFPAPVATCFMPVYQNNSLGITVDPYKNFFSKLGLFYRWDYNSMKFSVYGCDDSYIIYTMGSEMADTSKGAVKLNIVPKLVDGIPLIDVDALVHALDLNLIKDTENCKYFISHKHLDVDINLSGDITWDFNSGLYIDGFSMVCGDLIDASNGVVKYQSTSNGRRHDPAFTSPTTQFDAAKYQKIVVGMSYDVTGGYSSDAKGITSSMFFVNPNENFNGNDVVQVSTKGFSTNGEIIEIEFDMSSNDNYYGTIEKIRFDPFEAVGTFTIDYIKVILTNPDGVINIKNKATEFVWKPGEDTPDDTKFSAVNCKMSVDTDPTNKENKVFKVDATAKSRAWSYFNVFMNFVPGKTYKVNYKIYGTEDASGEKFANCTSGANFIFGTDGVEVKNHSFGSAKIGSDAGWITVEATYTVPTEYIPSTKDCFQIWSDPTNTNMSTGYLVSDISVVIIE